MAEQLDKKKETTSNENFRSLKSYEGSMVFLSTHFKTQSKIHHGVHTSRTASSPQHCCTKVNNASNRAWSFPLM